MKIVEVEWIDAATCAEDVHSLEEAQAHSGAKACTVGYLLKEDKEVVILSMTNFYGTTLPNREIPEEGFKFLWIIPKGCIQSIKKK